MSLKASNINHGRIWFLILLYTIPVGSALLVGFFESSRINADLSGSTTRWEQLPVPPTDVLDLIGIDNYELFVRTSKDQIYVADLDICFKTTQGCWQAISPSEPIQPPKFTDCWYEFKVMSPPPNVIQRIDNCEGGSGGVLRANAVLLSDGNVLVWKHVIYDLSGLAVLAIPIYAFLGLIIGIFVSTILAVLYRKKFFSDA